MHFWSNVSFISECPSYLFRLRDREIKTLTIPSLLNRIIHQEFFSVARLIYAETSFSRRIKYRRNVFSPLTQLEYHVAEHSVAQS